MPWLDSMRSILMLFKCVQIVPQLWCYSHDQILTYLYDLKDMLLNKIHLTLFYNSHSKWVWTSFLLWKQGGLWMQPHDIHCSLEVALRYSRLLMNIYLVQSTSYTYNLAYMKHCAIGVQVDRKQRPSQGLSMCTSIPLSWSIVKSMLQEHHPWNWLHFYVECPWSWNGSICRGISLEGIQYVLQS